MFRKSSLKIIGQSFIKLAILILQNINDVHTRDRQSLPARTYRSVRAGNQLSYAPILLSPLSGSIILNSKFKILNFFWYQERDSNSRPQRYECCALTN